jgi:hypothetical protein
MRSIQLLIFLFISFIANGQSNSAIEEKVKLLSIQKNLYMNADSINKLNPMLSERLVFIHSNGMTESKSDLIEKLKIGKWSLNKVNVKESSVRIFKNDMAILIGKGTFIGSFDAKPFELELYFTEVWSKYKKNWLLVSRHANKLP